MWKSGIFKKHKLCRKNAGFILAVVMFFSAFGGARALDISDVCNIGQSQCQVGSTLVTPLTIAGCEQVLEYCYGKYRYISCQKCSSGYKLGTKTGTGTEACGKMGYSTCMVDAGQCEVESEITCRGVASMVGMDNCKTRREYCFGNTKVATCAVCQDGYVLIDDEFSVVGCPNKYQRKICVSDGGLTKPCGGKICMVGTRLNLETCECESIVVKCKSGWYQNLAKDGCIACPGNKSTDSGVYDSNLEWALESCGLNSNTTGTIFDCYYKGYIERHDLSGSGTKKFCDYEDDTGYYYFEDDCHYKQSAP